MGLGTGGPTILNPFVQFFSRVIEIGLIIFRYLLFVVYEINLEVGDSCICVVLLFRWFVVLLHKWSVFD